MATERESKRVREEEDLELQEMDNGDEVPHWPHKEQSRLMHQLVSLHGKENEEDPEADCQNGYKG